MNKAVISAGKMTDSERLKQLLYQSIHSHGLNPENTFLLLATLLDREFSGDDENEAATRFVEFVSNPHPKGLGINPPRQLEVIVQDLKHPQEHPPYNDGKIIKRMNAMRRRVGVLLRRSEPAIAMHGVNQHSGGSNATSSPLSDERGSNYALKRLKRDHPELAEKVIAGDLSANAAAIEAGFRHKPTPYQQIVRLLPKLTADERQQLKDELGRAA